MTTFFVLCERKGNTTKTSHYDNTKHYNDIYDYL